MQEFTGYTAKPWAIPVFFVLVVLTGGLLWVLALYNPRTFLWAMHRCSLSKADWVHVKASLLPCVALSPLMELLCDMNWSGVWTPERHFSVSQQPQAYKSRDYSFHFHADGHGASGAGQSAEAASFQQITLLHASGIEPAICLTFLGTSALSNDSFKPSEFHSKARSCCDSSHAGYASTAFKRHRTTMPPQQKQH